MPTPEVVRHRRRRRLIVLGVMALVLAGIAANERLTALIPASVIKLRLRPNATELRLFQLANNVRLRAGLPPLTFSSPLMAATYFHSADMAGTGCLSFDGPAGDTPVDRVTQAGLSYRELAENLYTDAAGNAGRLAGRALAQWLARPAWRANLLSPRFRATAIAIARAADGSLYLTQDFIQ